MDEEWTEWSGPQERPVTIIVRFWMDEGGADDQAWRGVAERIGSERHCAFQTWEELMNWLRLEVAKVHLHYHK